MTNKIVPLVSCSCCHKRIKDGEPFARFDNQYYCNPCFITHLDDIDLQSFQESNILVTNSMGKVNTEWFKSDGSETLKLVNEQ